MAAAHFGNHFRNLLRKSHVYCECCHYHQHCHYPDYLCHAVVTVMVSGVSLTKVRLARWQAGTAIVFRLGPCVGVIDGREAGLHKKRCLEGTASQAGILTKIRIDCAFKLFSCAAYTASISFFFKTNNHIFLIIGKTTRFAVFHFNP